MEVGAGFPVHHGGQLMRYLWDCSRKFPYCSVPESWLAAMLAGAFLTVIQVRSHPSQIHMPIPIGDLYLIAVEVVSDKPLHQNGRFSSHSGFPEKTSQPAGTLESRAINEDNA